MNDGYLFCGVHFLLDQQTELHLWSLKVAGVGNRVAGFILYELSEWLMTVGNLCLKYCTRP